MTILSSLRKALGFGGDVAAQAEGPRRGAVVHVIIIDGTMSSLTPGRETNAGLTYKLIAEAGHRDVSLRYEAGVQWQDWRHTRDIIEGRGINRQIMRVYGFLASRYRPGDRIFLLGYSRGAYAVRSLAGVIDRVGLLRRDHATERAVRLAYRHYQRDPGSRAANAFARRFCHPDVPIEMVGVWDTVKALGIRLPILWRWSQPRHAFHSTHLGRSIQHGFHALALDETRRDFTPVLWECPQGWEGHIEQVWFAGTHGDIGGQLNSFDAARPRANIPLVWMLDRIEACGLSLPEGWKDRFAQDVTAPSVGNWRGWSKIFWSRRRREVGRDPSESLHPSVLRSLGTNPSKGVAAGVEGPVGS